jgi:hypothetical protein
MSNSETYIVHLYSQERNKKIRLDFSSQKVASELIDLLKLSDYNIYQFILGENRYSMTESQLNEMENKYELLKRQKKSLFGLCKKTILDLLILPKSGFYFPYKFGNYLYLFTKKLIVPADFESWINIEFPNRFEDFDKVFAGLNSDPINLLDNEDYFIITNYDYQTEFGIIGKSKTIDLILDTFRKAEIKDFEEKIY